LNPVLSDGGGHEVMNVMTGAKMTKGRIWEMPITETIIQAVESLAKSQGYKSLKLKGKNKTRLLPSDWDEDEEHIFDDNYESDDDDSDDDNEDEMERYDEIDHEELDDLNNDNNNNENNNNDNEEDDDEVEQQNNEQNEQQPDEQPADNDNNRGIEEDGPDIIPDDTSETGEGRNRTQPERLTYDRLGATHQQMKKK